MDPIHSDTSLVLVASLAGLAMRINFSILYGRGCTPIRRIMARSYILSVKVFHVVIRVSSLWAMIREKSLKSAINLHNIYCNIYKIRNGDTVLLLQTVLIQLSLRNCEKNR